MLIRNFCQIPTDFDYEKAVKSSIPRVVNDHARSLRMSAELNGTIEQDAVLLSSSGYPFAHIFVNGTHRVLDSDQPLINAVTAFKAFSDEVDIPWNGKDGRHSHHNRSDLAQLFGRCLGVLHWCVWHGQGQSSEKDVGVGKVSSADVGNLSSSKGAKVADSFMSLLPDLQPLLRTGAVLFSVCLFTLHLLSSSPS